MVSQIRMSTRSHIEHEFSFQQEEKEKFEVIEHRFLPCATLWKFNFENTISIIENVNIIIHSIIYFIVLCILKTSLHKFSLYNVASTQISGKKMKLVSQMK